MTLSLVRDDVHRDYRSLHDLVDEYLSERVAMGEITPKTGANLGRRFRELYAAHSDRPIAQLDRKTINAWRMRIGHQSPVTRNAYLSTVKGFCQWLVIEGHLVADPTTHVKRGKEPRRVPRARSKSDVARILAHCQGPRERLMVWLMVGMGLRCVEIAQAEIVDYDRSKQQLLVRGKGSNERLLPVPTTVQQAILAYRESLPAERTWAPGPLIRSNPISPTGIPTRANLEGRPLRSQEVSNIVTRILRDAGLKQKAHDGISPHALRHTAASDVLDRTSNVRTVQTMLGHSSLATTQIYLRSASLGQLRDGMEGRFYEDGEDPV